MNSLTVLRTKNNVGKPCFVVVFDEVFQEKLLKENDAVEVLRDNLKNLKNGQMTFHDIVAVDSIELGDTQFVVEKETVVSDIVQG